MHTKLHKDNFPNWIQKIIAHVLFTMVFTFHYNYRASMWRFFRPMWSTLNPQVVRSRLMARSCSLLLTVMTTNFFQTVLYRILGKVTIWPTSGSKFLIGKYKNKIMAICVIHVVFHWLVSNVVYLHVGAM